MARELSAKDKAFEKERARFRHEIAELRGKVSALEHELEFLQSDLAEKDATVREQKEWIDRLLEYANMSEKELKDSLEASKNVNHMCEVLDVMSKFTNGMFTL